ncbi:MCE family protein [Prosthecochloris sp. N3]|uniref:MCE family protein n=1 Tax=Prosthecochloris ethylica TaxID=2743976 RepID=A0ABR9XU89_9CHLB|nr:MULTISPECIES: MlaD family protein [Prosthecochloris]MEC9487119.1 MlaD family protein [Prosthecochloris sp.]MBF0587339.1 MCE family protein [Prosthecochloris ethylica]MBF0637632.1 MCE family protein [Prosthecochloris ethylica]NUK48263.1 MCE family protein [Prosthecochloris ethylica]RNA64521.1 MCE family protein [Prosthecochloris sp. ZM_2]
MRNPNTLKWSDLKTGIFFVIGISLAAYLGLVVGKNSSLFKSQTTINMLATDVESLAENNFVSLSGKKIGTVSSLHFVDEQDSLYVLIQMKLHNEYAGIVTKDSRGSIKSLGILGDKYIDITTGSGEPVEDGDYIQIEPAEGGIGSLTENAGKTLAQINTLLDGINSGKGPLAKLIGSEEMASELEQTVTNLQTVSRELSGFSSDLNNGNGLLQKMMNDETFANDIKTTFSTISTVASRTDSLIQKLNSEESTFGQLHSNPALYSNLNESVKALDSLLVDLKKNPDRYVQFSLF